MGDWISLKPILDEVVVVEEEQDLVADAQRIVRALVTRRNLTRNSRKILADLGTQLCSISEITESKNDEEEGLSEIEGRLNVVQNQVMNWEVDEYMIWDCGSEEASEYIKAVDEAQKLTETLESSCSNREGEENKLLRRAHYVLNMAMVRLEKEFRHILVKNRQCFKLDTSFRSNEEDVETEGSFISSGDGSLEDPFKHLLVQNRQPFEPERVSFRPREIYVGNEGSKMLLGPLGDELAEDLVSKISSEDFVTNFVHPSVIPDLKCIAKTMLESKCHRECTQAFISVQKDALDDCMHILLDDCMHILAVENLGIEDVLKMEWGILAPKIRRCIQAMKIFVRVYLASEKRLSDQIFGDFASFSSDCFVEASKASMLQLLNFCEAIVVRPLQSEKLIPILGMYEVLADLIPYIFALYTDEVDSYMRNQCQYVLWRLGSCCKTTFLDFEYLLAINVSTTPFLGEGIHPLSRYVMNFIICLTDYTETLNLVLKDTGEENAVSFSSHVNPTVEDNANGRSSLCVSPMALHFRSLISILEANLDDKSKLCKEDSLRHLFLMNNIHYMTQKVKDSELRTILGDEWIRKHNWKFQQQAMNYERATWSSILSLLRDEGIHYPGSTSVSRTLLKERMQSFYVAFEEVYKIQTAWLIPDIQLREDLRISVSVKVIQAYRTFVGVHGNNLSDKSIKYSADDLENFLFHLFGGSPRSLKSFHRK
ncbi:hypothetical protein Vadar_006653 [Vaccinium darrowii]|uniref:Uncharacterized protein n=1 Tax=Vaccinium darrowii TaxID=229202 RepID=A0ACB7XYS1_9ERIC|nr:hypothetical protein Vadar_006653 [Vaccinium darrowii]